MNLASETSREIIAICARFGRDATRLMDIALEVQRAVGHIDEDATDTIARELQIPRVDVDSLVSFYSFFADAPRGLHTLRLCNDVTDRHAGSEAVAKAWEEELGIRMGQTTPDGMFHLEWTACIGMSDQAPAAMVDDVVVTRLTPWKARWVIRQMREHGNPRRLVTRLGDGRNAHPLIGAMVENNLRRRGSVHFAERVEEAGLRRALAMDPSEVIARVKRSGLRGRGGAGFPTGVKWEMARNAQGGQHYIFCNADEGEPGTFKDRVLLTERAHAVFEGMTIGGWAIGATEGVVYLRAEYAYLRPHLEDALRRRRREGLLGANVLGQEGFDFDIRIQMGAGAYVCGEETSLISSCEGLRGDPKDRPPFPVQKGFLGNPTPVNNVESFSCVARIFEESPEWFAEQGLGEHAGTKLYSVCGDCERPGVYELPFGTSLDDLLREAGGEGAGAVCVGGPSGTIVPPSEFHRALGYGDLATGGAVIVFSPERDPLQIAADYVDFFVHESCGTCTPCRVGNVLMQDRLGLVLSGRGTAADLDYLEETGETMRVMSRCGLGQTASNPVTSTLRYFRDRYEKRLAKEGTTIVPGFDVDAALDSARVLAGRDSSHFPAGSGGPR